MSGKFRTLWQIMEGQRLRYAAAIGAILISAVFMFARPIIVRFAIDYVIKDDPLAAPAFFQQWLDQIGARSVLAHNLWIASIALVATTAVSGLFGYFRGKWAAIAAESIARRLRDRVYDHLQHLPCRYHDDAESGDLVQRATSDIETVRLFLAMQVAEIGRALILMATALPIMLYLNVRMAMLSMLVVPVVVIFAVVFFMKIRPTFKKQTEAEGKMTSRLQENLTGVRVVRAFARQKHECQQFAAANEAYRFRSHNLIRLFSYYWPATDLLCIGQTSLVLVAGAYYASIGEMTIGTMYAFMTFVNMFLWPVRHMGRVLADMGKATVSLGRIGEILSVPVEADRPQARRLAEPARGRIEIDSLSFAHVGDQDVLSDVSVTIEAGQTLAILGPSGSGKSTLISLLLRLYDYEDGAIRLDGVDLRDLPRKHVRSQIGSVLQEPFLYSKSLRDNIKLGRSGSDDETMIGAATAAAVHESITRFDTGYDTLVGERGVTLSGGQRQRVALARALLTDPPVLILDDAFSAIDTRTESAILSALRQRHQRRTTLVIAHRLSTLMHADRIIVLEGGSIVQDGTHDDLVAAEGMYRRLWQIQRTPDEDLDDTLQPAAS